MGQAGMGVIHESTHDRYPLYTEGLNPTEAERRRALWYRPYAQALTDLVDETLAQHGRCLVIDLHSYAPAPLDYELHGDAERPEVCLGFEPFHDPGIEMVEEVFQRHGFETARNQPFSGSGSYVPLAHWRTDEKVKSVMIEIRKDQYLDGTGTRLNAVLRLATAIADYVDF